MKFGKKHGFIRSNPFADVDPIKKTKSRPTRALTLDEIRRFIEVLDDFWKPLFILLFFTGVRIGEAAGLKWKRVDLVNSVVQIRKTIVYVNGGYVYERSARFVLFQTPIRFVWRKSRRTFRESLSLQILEEGLR